MRCMRLRAIRLIPFSSSVSPSLSVVLLFLSVSPSLSYYLSLHLYFSRAYKRRLYITWPRSRIAVLWERKSRALKTRSVSVRVTRSAAVDSYRSRKYVRPSLIVSVLLFLLSIALSIPLHFRLSARSVSHAEFIMPVELPRPQNFRMHCPRAGAQLKWFLLNGLNYSRD